MITNFDDIKSGTPTHGVGYHWTDPGVTLDEDIRDGSFYISDDIYEWSAPWLDGMTAYKVEYRIDNPYCLRLTKEIYEYIERNLLNQHPTADAIVYTPHAETYGRSHRQMLLTDPKRQIKSTTLVTPDMLVNLPRLQTDAGPDYFDNHLPIIANNRNHKVGDNDTAAEEYDIYAINQFGALVKQHLKDVLPEGRTAAELFQDAAVNLRRLAGRFENQADGNVAPRLEVGWGAAALVQLPKADLTAVLHDKDTDLCPARLERQALLHQSLSNELLAKITGECSLGYSNGVNFQNQVGHPSQPVEVAADNIVRFKPNAIVKYMVENGPWDLDRLSTIGTGKDYSQLAQQLGYSVSGWGDLSIVNDARHAAVELNRHVSQQKYEADLSLNLTELKDVPPVPGITQTISNVSDSAFMVPWEWAVLLHEAIRDDVKLYVTSDKDQRYLEVSVFDMPGDGVSDVYTGMLGDEEIAIAATGKLTFSSNDVEVVTIAVDLDQLSHRLKTNAVTVPAIMTIKPSMMFNNGMLTKKAPFRPEWLYLLLESVWRFMSIRKKILTMLDTAKHDLTDVVVADIQTWLCSGWGQERPVSGLLVESLSHRPKPTCNDGIILLGMYNIYHSGIHLCDGELSVEQTGLYYSAKIDDLEQHLGK